MTMMSGAQMLVRTLEDLGVDNLFGYPGGAVLDIYDALLESKKIKHVLGRHEQGVAHAADGYARATGKVGVCLVTSGPGATNTVTSIATAYMDSIPMVVITGQVISPLIGSDAFQEVDTVGITRPIVKHSYLCQCALDIPKYIRQAFYLASSGRPGPVVVDIPKDCVRPSVKFEYPEMKSPVKMRSYNPTKQGHKGQVKRAAKLLAEASHPVLLIGGGAQLSGAKEEVRTIAHRFNLPVTSTLMGLGVYPSSDKQFLGMLGMHGTFEANNAMDKADLVFAVGCRFDDRVTNNLSKFCPAAKIIHIDIDPASISKTVVADIPIVGDAKTVLGQFIDVFDEFKLVENASAMKQWWTQIGKWRENKCLDYASDGKIIQPQQIVESVYKATHGEAIIATDVGQHQMFAALYYKFDEPRHLLTSGGLGTMGYGFPAAVGAKIGCPDKEVCLFTGDGSFQMNVQELSTCLEFNIPIKIFIFDNHTLGMVRQWQKMFYRGHISSTNLNSNPDFVALAKAYGHEGIRVTDPKELDAAVEKALSMKDKLVIVDIACDTDAKVLPMQQMGGSMSDMFLGEE
ncbi:MULTISPECIES: biosynthetic-type acetolactate synthase large subunit [Succinivibrio]|uniref:Acetolactate synthase n=1 Tax=Succinivibrio dextrinosolvens TaxID=83771 RepID=A0A662Z7R4_9GAMM|nr:MULTISPECIES: biosynthetic-type acetolactate synthase large subunit [Succinivibrio]MBQ9219910.1 biosynthetic-type acetolactate synthase large subunit [Succinivibrio sp.]SFJ92444.1 acetolactate synthase, large subunit [Succinivibrio dextrinosolvens]